MGRKGTDLETQLDNALKVADKGKTLEQKVAEAKANGGANTNAATESQTVMIRTPFKKRPSQQPSAVAKKRLYNRGQVIREAILLYTAKQLDMEASYDAERKLTTKVSAADVVNVFKGAGGMDSRGLNVKAVDLAAQFQQALGLEMQRKKLSKAWSEGLDSDGKPNIRPLVDAELGQPIQRIADSSPIMSTAVTTAWMLYIRNNRKDWEADLQFLADLQNPTPKDAKKRAKYLHLERNYNELLQGFKGEPDSSLYDKPEEEENE